MTSTFQSLTRIIALAAALSLTGGAAIAASGGGSSSGGADTPACKAGYVWNAKSGKCELKTSSTMDDNSLYQQGRNLALAGRYREALTTLGAVSKPDSMVLTMIGYSERKLGHYQQGIGWYAKALALDPRNANAHEYLGEAYAEHGRPDLARAELAKVRDICGTGCEQYRDLSGAISGLAVKS